MEEYLARIEVLRELGEGYTEVSLADRPYPCLTFGFRGGYGVIHQDPYQGRMRRDRARLAHRTPFEAPLIARLARVGPLGGDFRSSLMNEDLSPARLRQSQITDVE